MTATPHRTPGGDARTSDDFVIVRPDLVRRVGNGNAAIVYARIEFRCAQPGQNRIEDEAGRWWRASIPTVSEETGLTVKMARTALDNLEKRGEIETWTHRAGGVSDQTSSYRPASPPAICPNGQMDVPKRADDRSGACPNGQMDVPKRADHHLPKRADVPSIEELEEGGGHAGISSPVPENHQPPSKNCPKHPQGSLAPCGGCASAREAHQAWQTERTRAERQAASDTAQARAGHRAAAVAACNLCDTDGYAGTTVCDHDPDATDRAKRGSAAARSVLAEARARKELAR